jgi:hypothetical protein
VQSFLLDANPLDKVAVGSKIKSKRQSYSVAQVTHILTRAQAEIDDIFLLPHTERVTRTSPAMVRSSGSDSPQ